MARKWLVGLVVFVSVSLTALFAGNLTFLPDASFKGSSLAGWRSLGQAEWRAQDGELIGMPKADAGGWLVLEKSYEDVAFHALFRCSGACRTGVMLRATKTPEGMTGVFVSLDEGDLAGYKVTLDSSGKILTREPLRPAGGMVRVAPPPDPNRGGPGQGGRGRRGRPEGPADLPLTRPSTELRPGEWNDIEIVIDANILRATLNSGGGPGGAADEDAGTFGPVALYAGGAGEVRFKDVAYKDLGFRVLPDETVSPKFRMQRINDHYYGWAAAAADFNRDGVLDVAAGPFIYYGPDFTRSKEIFLSTSYSPSREFSEVGGQFAFDFNKDGWPDIMIGPPWAVLYINPKGESRRWDKYRVVPAVQSEVVVMSDIDRDGVPDYVYAADGRLHYAKAGPDATRPWIVRTVSEQGYGLAHGIGAGDVNGDGLPDILNPYGWWEQPANDTGTGPWTYHPTAFTEYGRGGLGGATMGVYDVNGDGLNDVVTSLIAHGFGLAWFEQKRDGAGKITFIQHTIAGDYAAKNAGGVSFSEPHGATFADVDGDGVMDFIVGKRHFSHVDTYLDPDPHGPPVLYVYRTVRNKKAPGGAEFVPELIHNRSGVGSDLLAIDLNKDGRMDIVTSTNRGTFIFWGKR